MQQDPLLLSSGHEIRAVWGNQVLSGTYTQNAPTTYGTYPLTAGFSPHSDSQAFCDFRLEEVRKQSSWGPLHLNRHEPMDLYPVAQHPGHHIGLGCRNGYKPRSQMGRNVRMTDVVPKQLHHLCAFLEVGLAPFPLHFHVQLRAWCAVHVSDNLSIQTCLPHSCRTRKGLGTLSLGSCYSFHGTKLPNCFWTLMWLNFGSASHLAPPP